MKAYGNTGMKIYINELGYMNKMAARSLYSTLTLKKLLFFQNQWIDGLETLYVALSTQALQGLFKLWRWVRRCSLFILFMLLFIELPQYK